MELDLNAVQVAFGGQASKDKGEIMRLAGRWFSTTSLEETIASV